jgi:O-methyltransferase
MRILIFGTGSGLGDLLSMLPVDIVVVGLLDNDARKQGTRVHDMPVYPPQVVSDLEFDRIVVSPRDGAAIRNQLVDLGVPREKILLFYSAYDATLRKQVNQDTVALNRDLGLGMHPLSLCTMQMWPVPSPEIEPFEDDYCRFMAMRLAAQRILARNIPGAVAELGVYKGELASVLNRLFPERTLYLFDTFEGFSQNDLADGQEKKHSVARVGEFQDTNVDLVLSRMSHPEKVVVRKGYFPDTAQGLEDTFALVSLDADLYKPIAAGLRYFYPRLSPGGCIFVHDFNNRRYQGVKTAVEEFIDVTGAPLVQLPDLAGTAILTK